MARKQGLLHRIAADQAKAIEVIQYGFCGQHAFSTVSVRWLAFSQASAT
ncbi:hypothetical protein [Burkholderia ubonensis]|nr:hypothetical protein [Burkholderia ubonensis]